MQGPKKVRGNKDLLTASNPQIRRSRRFLEGFDWGPWSQLAAFPCPDDCSWFLPLRNFGVRVRDQRIFLGLTWHIGCRQQGSLLATELGFVEGSWPPGEIGGGEWVLRHNRQSDREIG